MSDNSSEQEPSIEEILSSIRQIISDDDEEAVVTEEDLETPEEAVEDPIHHERDDVLELSEEDLVPEEPKEPEIEPEILDDIVMQDADDEILDEEEDDLAGEDNDPDEIEMRSKIEEELANIRNAMNGDEEDFTDEIGINDMSDDNEFTENDSRPVPSDILSSGTQAAALGALNKLTSKMPVNSSRSYDGVTLEDIVREMLHPMMREWMDDNLPPMVERIVQKEIEKLSRRAMDDY